MWVDQFGPVGSHEVALALAVAVGKDGTIVVGGKVGSLRTDPKFSKLAIPFLRKKYLSAVKPILLRWVGL